MPSTVTKQPVPATVTKCRWNFRVAHDADEFVREAAALAHLGLTEFVVKAAMSEAERVLADRTHFVLEPSDWDRFIEMLDRPAQENPGLAKLFSEPSVFE